MKWENDWPVIGVDYDKNGVGEPVARFAKPNVGREYPPVELQTSDEFESTDMGLQWQWNGNPNNDWCSVSERRGWMRLHSQPTVRAARNLWDVPGLLLQKMPAPAFSVATQVDCRGQHAGERVGLIVFGMDYAYIGIVKTEPGYRIVLVDCRKADKGTPEQVVDSADISHPGVHLRIDVKPENPGEIIPKVLCTFAYSVDGVSYKRLGESFVAREGTWVGAKVGVFASAPSGGAGHGHADLDWFRVGKPDDSLHR
jgi:beta-xylosidase